MLLHYDTRTKGSAALPEDILQNLRDAIAKPTPEWVGRALRRLE